MGRNDFVSTPIASFCKMNDGNASIMHEHDATASLKGSFGKRTRIIVSLNGVQQNFDGLGGCACSFKVVAASYCIRLYFINHVAAKQLCPLSHISAGQGFLTFLREVKDFATQQQRLGDFPFASGQW